MAGSKDLGFLLKNMKPIQIPGEFVFCSIDEKRIILEAPPLLSFREAEGLTIVISRSAAESHQLEFDTTWGLVTLSVHSDLAAVGFLAKVTQYLAKAGVSVNVVSAYYHDHLFVPFTDVRKTIELLTQLSKDYSQ
ncbi:MAG: ACT domain-containing protein [Candidatus Thorarchaeota archaeon]